MGESWNPVLGDLLKAQIHGNDQITEVTIRLLRSFSESIQEDTRRLQEAVGRIDTLVNQFDMPRGKNPELEQAVSLQEKMENTKTVNREYPAAFFYQAGPEEEQSQEKSYYVLLDQTEEGDIHFQIFTSSGKLVEEGVKAEQYPRAFIMSDMMMVEGGYPALSRTAISLEEVKKLPFSTVQTGKDQKEVNEERSPDIGKEPDTADKADLAETPDKMEDEEWQMKGKNR